MDKSYEVGVIVKGIDGGLEVVGALIVSVVPPSAFYSLAQFLTRSELSEDPQDFIASHVLHYGNLLAGGHTWFLALYLVTHGTVKIGLVVALLRQKHWAYPWAIGILTLFLAYQVYLLTIQPTVLMGFFTVLDTAIIGLVWREWTQVRSRTRVVL